MNGGRDLSFFFLLSLKGIPVFQTGKEGGQFFAPSYLAEKGEGSEGLFPGQETPLPSFEKGGTWMLSP